MKMVAVWKNKNYIISKSNAMRRSAKEKEGELKSIEEAIDKKLEALKN